MTLQTPLLAQTPPETGHGGGTRIKRRLPLFLAGLLLLTIGLIYYQNDSFRGMVERNVYIRFKPHQEGKAEDLSTKEAEVSSSSISSQSTKSTQVGNGFIKQKQYPACPIPQLEPFHESIQFHVDRVYIPQEYNCTANYPLLFNSTVQSTIVPAKGQDYFRDEGYESCCYRTVASESANETDYPQCFPVSLTAETKIPDEHELISIFCKRKGQNQTETLADMHSFAHLKPSNGTKEMEDQFNVVIFGMDGMSRLNFLRTMPQSYSFLKNELDAVEMFGYNKVGENTIDNIMPMLTEYGDETDVDNNCPLIWEKYSKQGYYTMISEDGSAPFLQGHPIDYYFYSHSDSNFRTYPCYGPRLTFQVLLEYMEKYVDTMSRNKKKFFGISWSTPLTHDFLHTAGLGDPHLLESLRWLKGSGHLNNTIFILMGDHGVRLDAIRNTIQGQLEERLPVLYFVLPESFKIKYSRAHKNLLYNADKLVTTYDLHQTLKEILNLDMIENRKLLKRENDLFHLGRNLPQGISLFLPVPEFRTCEMAWIMMNFCSCTYMEVANVSDPEIDAVGKAKLAVSHINSLIEVNIANITDTTSPDCAILELNKVSMVSRVGYPEDSFWNGYTITLETKPGGGQFEALVSIESDGGLGGGWNVRGPVVRTNQYGNQSHCVRNIIQLKPYCYCLN